MGKSKLIATCIDDKYLWPWLVLVKSAVVNAQGANFRIALGNINGMLSAKSITAATEFCNLEGIQLEVIPLNFRYELFFEHQFNLTVYGRLLFMDAMKEDFIWFDADLLLLQDWTKILDFQSLNDSSSTISAVLDTKRTREKLKKLDNVALAAVADRYFNAGVMQVAHKNWQSVFKPSDWVTLAKNTRKLGLIHNDQDILNLLLVNRVCYLPNSYNHIVSDPNDFTYQNHILHFAGYPKPWRLTTKGARLFLALSGIKFRPNELEDKEYDLSFLHFEAYWAMEGYVFKSLTKLEPDLMKHILKLRNSTLMDLNSFEKIKYYLFTLIGRKFF